MNERCFYGSRHGRGGIEVDENTMSPNAAYWRGCARGAFQRLERAIGTEKAVKVAPNREPGQTWRDVYGLVSTLADLAERQVESELHREDELGTHVIVSGGECLEL